MSNLKDKKLFLLDMDGTIYLDNDLFDGTLEFLEQVKNNGGRYIFITNNSSKSVDKYVEKLASLGIEATADDFLTSNVHTASKEEGISICILASLFNSLRTPILIQLPHEIRRLFLYK